MILLKVYVQCGRSECAREVGYILHETIDRIDNVDWHNKKQLRALAAFHIYR